MSELENVSDPDIRNSLVAMRRAAQMARDEAIRTGTAIVIERGGQLVRITADELMAESRAMP